MFGDGELIRLIAVEIRDVVSNRTVFNVGIGGGVELAFDLGTEAFLDVFGAEHEPTEHALLFVPVQSTLENIIVDEELLEELIGETCVEVDAAELFISTNAELRELNFIVDVDHVDNGRVASAAAEVEDEHAFFCREIDLPFGFPMSGLLIDVGQKRGGGLVLDDDLISVEAGKNGGGDGIFGLG